MWGGREEKKKFTFSRAPAGPELESSREEREEVLSGKKEQRKSDWNDKMRR